MDERLERWEREHEKRKILAKDAVRVDLSSASDLNAGIDVEEEEKEENRPERGKES